MANPRQRRKQRSQHKAVRHSNRAKKNLKKMPTIRGPKALQEAWNRNLTVKQNYARLGLLSTLNPRAKGGSENVYENTSTGGGETTSAYQQNGTSQSEIPAGHGRIIRDANGDIIDVQIEEEGTEELLKSEEQLPLGPEAGVWTARRKPNTESTGMIKELENLSRNVSKVPRTASSGEKQWLRDLVAKYGDNFEAAARDRRLNPWQRTAGEIKRSISKAGGISHITQ
ncbi:hypothetical protein CPB86DRAFT_349507 [Serendipita vermifera]|nr:hypothetical protein CPB86DRAFT_349507 [Serendipita vermifera]